MNPIVYAIPVFMVTILMEAAWAAWKGRRVYDVPDAISSLHLGVMSQVVGALAVLGIYKMAFNAFHGPVWSDDNPVYWLVALLFYDLCYYWAHRLGHEVNVLWAAHVVHHTSEYYNLSTALRQTSSGLLFGWVFYLPMAVMGVPPHMFVVVGLIDLLYQYWVHTELIARLGWLDRIFVTPSNHRVHHGQNDYCIDKNYGGILIVWDRLFGTFVDEREDEPIHYGIRTPLASYNPLWGNLHYYVYLWQASRAAQGWRAKLGVWLEPPAGWGQAVQPMELTATQRYNCQTPSDVQWYTGLQYALLVPVVSHFLSTVPTLTRPLAFVYGAWIIFSCWSISQMLEMRARARLVEGLRMAVSAGALVLLPEWFGWQTPDWMRVAVSAWALASILALQRLSRHSQRVSVPADVTA